MNRSQQIALRALVGELVKELQPNSALAARLRGEVQAPAPAASGAWDIRQELGPADRVVMLPRPLQRPIPVRPQPQGGDKPSGLWYSVGPAWVDFCREVLPKREAEHHYRLTLDRSRLLEISSAGDLDAFFKEYAVVGSRHYDHSIDWGRVAASGGGLEVAPYIGRVGQRVTWAYSWDVPSGVLWDDSLILDAELIPRQAPFVPHVAKD